MRRALRAVWGAVLVVALALAALAVHDARAPRPAPWLAAAGLQARFAVVGGHRLRYVRAGRGPAVVLVHGFGSSLYTWKDVIPALAADHQVVALDLPGFGLSDQPGDLRIDELPLSVLGLMDRLEIGSAVLVGNSMGGAAVALAAARRPERTRALVLVDAAGFDLGPWHRPKLVEVAISPLAGWLAWLPGKRLLVELALREALQDRRLLTDERVAEYLQAARRPGSFASARSLGASLANRDRVVQDALASVRAPTLVVWGSDDAWIPLSHAGRFAAAIAGARQVTIAGCGHLPQEERPRELLRALVAFLREVEKQAGTAGEAAPAPAGASGASGRSGSRAPWVRPSSEGTGAG